MDRLIEGVRDAVGRWRQGLGSTEQVGEALADWRGATGAVSCHVRFDPERYQRHRLFRDDDVEVLLLCWEWGQATPIHDHDGQMGWFTVLQGGLVVHEFDRRGGPDDLASLGPGAALGPGSVSLSSRQVYSVCAGSTVCEAAAPETIHRVGSSNRRAVSLHVYARPLDSLLVFDDSAGSCRRVELPR